MRIAVVGAGISGLVAARGLSRAHEVVVFEAEPRLGGHTHTVTVDDPQVGPLAIDTGFIVYNDWTYPNFIALLGRLGVSSQPTSMSFSVRCDRSGLEYNGTSLNSLFAQRRNLLRPSFLGMIRDILRFNRESRALLADDGDDTALGDWLEARRYGRAFIEHYLVPMGAAIWSAPPQATRAMPARYFVEFFANHGMLSVDQRPQWHVVAGGSQAYLAPLVAPFRDGLRLGQPVEAVQRDPDGVTIVARGQPPERFDAAVLACHSDQALAMLRDPSPAEREVLGAVGYQPNDVVLHTDASVLPKRRLARASWNYRLDARGPGHPVAVTYWMNSLQGLRVERDYCVTLNQTADLDPARILGRWTYAHPVYTPAAVAAQGRRREVNGVRRTWYCGAWWGWGFHEDGVVSALAVLRDFDLALA